MPSPTLRPLALHVPALLLLAAFSPTASAQWRSEGPTVGTVNHLAFDPSGTGVVYAATAGGGVWRSDDGGASWRLPGDGMTSRSVRWLLVDPTRPATVWAGVEPNGGPAVWRSDDKGATWKLIGDGYKGALGRMHAVGQRITIGPQAPRTIFVPSSNLHYRSDDGGKTWTDFRVPNQDAYAFAVDPTNPKVVLAGGRGQTLNVSRSLDGGKTWKQTGLGLGQTSLDRLFFSTAEPGVVWAIGGSFGKVFKSVDRGDHFAPVELPVGGTSDVYDLVIDPRTGTLWAPTESGLLRSDDGGATWEESRDGLGEYLVKSVAFDPKNPSHLLAASAGTGVYSSTDGGRSWSPSSQGLAAGWVSRLYGSPRSPVVFAQLNVGLFRHGGSDRFMVDGWEELRRPFENDEAADVDGILFDRKTSTMYAFDGSKYWRSTDGSEWQEVEQKEPSMRDMMRGNLDSAQFAAMAQDAKDPRILYAGAWSNDPPGSVYKTTDGGKKWQPAGAGLPDERVWLLRTEAPNTVFAVVADEGVFRTTDGGAHWTASGSGLPKEKVRELVIDPTMPTRLYAATEKGLFKSTDNGTTWTRTGAKELEDVETVTINPANGEVYAGCFEGVFRSADGGATWAPKNEGLMVTDVRALVIAGTPARLWAGTAGGGVLSAPLP